MAAVESSTCPAVPEVKEVLKLSEHAQSLLKLARDTEFLQSFLRVDLGNDSDPEDTKNHRHLKSALKKVAEETGVATQGGATTTTTSGRPDHSANAAASAAGGASSTTAAATTSDKPHRDGDVTPRATAKTTFSQLTRDMKLTKKPRKKRNKDARQDFMYTDRDRASTVDMGSRDIKRDIKEKQKMDRSKMLQIPDEADPGTLLALGNYEMRNGNVSIAINFVHKALELNPSDKNALVARSRCYLLLGEPQKALQDAETALHEDKTFIRAIFQKAESLYHLGDFEHSLMFYHRGQRIRTELEGFRLGVQKAQEAIENTIGGKTIGQVPPKSAAPAAVSDDLITSASNSVKNMSDSARSKTFSESSNSRTKSRPESNRRRTSQHLLGELCVDKIYLEKLLNHPDIKCPHQESAKHITTFAEEGVAFLNNRQEFWRQQRSTNAVNKRPKKQVS